MPFANRQIEPIWLGRRTYTNQDKLPADLCNSPNLILVGALQQLGSLVQQADSIFAELSAECQKVASRTSKIKNRAANVAEVVERLNAKEVKVPVGDILDFATHVGHYRAEHGFDNGLFTPVSRPLSVADLYETADPSPLACIRRCNTLRADGRTGSKIFSVPLVLANEIDITTELQIAPHKPPVPPVVERPPKQLQQPRKRPHSFTALSDLDISPQTEDKHLPTPDELLRDLSRSQPVTLVPIDVSGSSFQRQCEQRSSQRSLGRDYVELDNSSRSLKRRKKRRQTICGVPGIAFDDKGSDYVRIRPIRTRSISRERWDRCREGYVDYYAPRVERSERRSRSRERKDQLYTSGELRDESPDLRSCSLRRSFRSLFRSRSKSRELWVEGRPASPGPPVVDFKGTLRRCRSLPRALSCRGKSKETPTFRGMESRSASTDGRLDAWAERETQDEILLTPLSSRPPKTPIPVGGSLPRIRRSHSQHMSGRMSTFLDGRPRSLADLHNRSQPVAVPMPTSLSSESAGSLTSNEQAHRHLNIVPGQPAWAAFAADVRLRQHDKGHDDRQSSSGHWSASSSSARQSLDSDYNRALAVHRSSQNSLKDSALSLNIHSSGPSEDRYDTTDNNNDVGDETSTVTGDASTVCGDTSTLHGSSNSLNTLRQDVKRVPNKLSKPKSRRSLTLRRLTSDSSTESALWASNSQLTQQNLRAHDCEYRTFLASPSPDEGSSVYSVDQDGFYTSMHKDSGMKRRSRAYMAGEDSYLGLSSSDSTLNSPLPPSGKKSGLFSTISKLRPGRRNKKKPPPPPPRRMSTIIDKSNLDLNELNEDGLFAADNVNGDSSKETVETVVERPLPSPVSPGLPEASECESDAEVVYARLKEKTSISTAAFPSLCAIGLSDEEDSDLSGSPWREQSPDYDSLRSSKSAPGKVYASTPVTGNDRPAPPNWKSPLSKGGKGIETIAIDVSNSTWPRPLSKPGTGMSSFLADNPQLASSMSLASSTDGNGVWSGSGLLSPPISQAPLGSNGSLYSDASRTRSSSLSSARHSIASSSVPSSNGDQPGRGGKIAPNVPKRKSSISSGQSHPSPHVYANVIVRHNTPGNINKVGSLESLPEDEPVTSTPAKHPLSLESSPCPSSLSSPYGSLSRDQHPKVVSRPTSIAYSGPVAAPAKLIISAPVATKVSFKQNPYKRSLCSPVSAQELQSIWNCDVEEEPTGLKSPMETDLDTMENTSLYGSSSVLNKPPRPALNKLPAPSNTGLGSYGKSWYDGIDTERKGKPAASRGETAYLDTPLGSRRTSEGGLSWRRDSNASSLSRDSGTSSALSGMVVPVTTNRRKQDTNGQTQLSTFSSFPDTYSLSSTPLSTPTGSLTRPPHRPMHHTSETSTPSSSTPTGSLTRPPHRPMHHTSETSTPSSSTPTGSLTRPPRSTPPITPTGSLTRPKHLPVQHSEGTEPAAGKTKLTLAGKTIPHVAAKVTPIVAGKAGPSVPTGSADSVKARGASPVRVMYPQHSESSATGGSQPGVSVIKATKGKSSKPASGARVSLSEHPEGTSTTTSPRVSPDRDAPPELLSLKLPTLNILGAATVRAEPKTSAKNILLGKSGNDSGSVSQNPESSIQSSPSRYGTNTVDLKKPSSTEPSVSKSLGATGSFPRLSSFTPKSASSITVTNAESTEALASAAILSSLGRVQSSPASRPVVSVPSSVSSVSPLGTNIATSVSESSHISHTPTPVLITSSPASAATKNVNSMQSEPTKSSSTAKLSLSSQMTAAVTSNDNAAKLGSNSGGSAEKSNSLPDKVINKENECPVVTEQIKQESVNSTNSDKSAIIGKPPLSSTCKSTTKEKDSLRTSTPRQRTLSASQSKELKGQGESSLSSPCNKSYGNLAVSTDTLNSIGSASNLVSSSLSLAKSTDSIASTGSNHAQKMRAAKLAFLASAEAPAPPPSAESDPFNRFRVGSRASPGKTSLKSTGSTDSGSAVASASQHKSPEDKPQAIQGRFVNSIITQYERQSSHSDEGSPPPTSPSSGIGSSFATTPVSPDSPSKVMMSKLNGPSNSTSTTSAHGYTDPKASSQYGLRKVNPGSTESMV